MSTQPDKPVSDPAPASAVASGPDVGGNEAKTPAETEAKTEAKTDAADTAAADTAVNREGYRSPPSMSSSGSIPRGDHDHDADGNPIRPHENCCQKASKKVCTGIIGCFCCPCCFCLAGAHPQPQGTFETAGEYVDQKARMNCNC